jgi:hypothetical protein
LCAAFEGRVGTTFRISGGKKEKAYALNVDLVILRECGSCKFYFQAVSNSSALIFVL